MKNTVITFVSFSSLNHLLEQCGEAKIHTFDRMSSWSLDYPILLLLPESLLSFSMHTPHPRQQLRFELSETEKQSRAGKIRKVTRATRQAPWYQTHLQMTEPIHLECRIYLDVSKDGEMLLSSNREHSLGGYMSDNNSWIKKACLLFLFQIFPRRRDGAVGRWRWGNVSTVWNRVHETFKIVSTIKNKTTPKSLQKSVHLKMLCGTSLVTPAEIKHSDELGQICHSWTVRNAVIISK